LSATGGRRADPRASPGGDRQGDRPARFDRGDHFAEVHSMTAGTACRRPSPTTADPRPRPKPQIDAGSDDARSRHRDHDRGRTTARARRPPSDSAGPNDRSPTTSVSATAAHDRRPDDRGFSANETTCPPWLRPVQPGDGDTGRQLLVAARTRPAQPGYRRPCSRGRSTLRGGPGTWAATVHRVTTRSPYGRTATAWTATA